jgi:hypothetical protein
LAGKVAFYDQVSNFFTELFGIKLGLLGDLGAGHDRQIVSGSLEEGLTILYAKDDRLVAALISGQTPETQAELDALLRARAHVSDLIGVSEKSISSNAFMRPIVGATSPIDNGAGGAPEFAR